MLNSTYLVVKTGDTVFTTVMMLLKKASLIVPLNHRDMKALGMTVDQVHAAAVANLRKRIPEIQTEGEPPVLMLVTGNDLEACLLLLE